MLPRLKIYRLQWRTLEGSMVAVATPDFFGRWVDPLDSNFLHHENSTTYKNIENKLLNNYSH